MHDYAVLHDVCLRKQLAECIAFAVGQVFLAQKRIAECQPRGNAVLLCQSQRFACAALTETRSSASPEAVRRCAVNGPNLTPVIKPVTICAV